MAEPETGKVNPNPEAAKTPARARAPDATKYVGTPAVGTSKAAAAGGWPEPRPRPRSTANAAALSGSWSPVS